MYNGMSRKDYHADQIDKRTLKRQKMAESARQRQYLDSTALRKKRIDNLEKLKNTGRDEELKKIAALMIPDGAVVEDGVSAATAMIENGDGADDGGGGEGVKRLTNGDNDDVDGPNLPKLRSCYVCKIRYRQLHKFYDQLCPACADLNYAKRHAVAALNGKVAVVTGARVKIGFQTCLKLLRSRCRVIAVTRFPQSAVRAYAGESDFDVWKDRLEIYGLDLRDVVGVEMFAAFVCQKYEKVDILINNACQTIRRPVGYYKPLVEQEKKLFEEFQGREDCQGLLKGCAAFEQRCRRGRSRQSSAPLVIEGESSQTRQPDVTNGNGDVNGLNATSLTISSSSCAPSFATTGLAQSARSSQIQLLPCDDPSNDASTITTALTDVNAQPLDLRKTNSWLLQLQDISTPEILETLLVNTVAPFVLNSRFVPLMQKCPHDDKYIINVSAMEGKFYRYKMPNHPHTNMAKAALNMMTRTSAEELATKYKIYMNSVDTGWINDENPLEKAAKTAKVNHFQTPIDEIDAAARILDPIFDGRKLFGKFFKDYKETEW